MSLLSQAAPIPQTDQSNTASCTYAATGNLVCSGPAAVQAPAKQVVEKFEMPEQLKKVMGYLPDQFKFASFK